MFETVKSGWSFSKKFDFEWKFDDTLGSRYPYKGQNVA